MRTISKNVYQYDELSEDAKEKAIQACRDIDTDYVWSEDAKQSLNAFEQEFGIKVKDWEYSTCSYSTDVTVNNEEESEMTGKRLIGYLYQYHSGVLFSPVVYEKNGKKRKSKILKQSACCPFTGYCADDDLLAPIHEYLRKPDAKNFRELMQECADSWAKFCMEDWAYQVSDDSIIDTILANNYEFYEDGSMV